MRRRVFLVLGGVGLFSMFTLVPAYAHEPIL